MNVEQVGVNALAQRFMLEKGLLAHALPLEMVPDELVWVQLRGIARKEVQFKPPFEATHVVGDQLGDVRRVPVENEKHLGPAPTHEALQQKYGARAMQSC